MWRICVTYHVDLLNFKIFFFLFKVDFLLLLLFFLSLSFSLFFDSFILLGRMCTFTVWTILKSRNSHVFMHLNRIYRMHIDQSINKRKFATENYKYFVCVCVSVLSMLLRLLLLLYFILSFVVLIYRCARERCCLVRAINVLVCVCVWFCLNPYHELHFFYYTISNENARLFAFIFIPISKHINDFISSITIFL